MIRLALCVLLLGATVVRADEHDGLTPGRLSIDSWTPDLPELDKKEELLLRAFLRIAQRISEEGAAELELVTTELVTTECSDECDSESDAAKLARITSEPDIAFARLAERYLAMEPCKFLTSFPRGDTTIAMERAQNAWIIVWMCRAAEIQEAGLLEPGRLKCDCDDDSNAPQFEPEPWLEPVITESIDLPSPPSTLDEQSSFKDAMLALFRGEFDDRLSRKEKRRKRVLNRRYDRAKRTGKEQQFFDSLFTGIEGDTQSFAMMPGVFGSDDFDQDTPLGLSAVGLFDLIDGLLERVPAIIEAIKMFIDLFAINEVRRAGPVHDRVWAGAIKAVA